MFAPVAQKVKYSPHTPRGESLCSSPGTDAPKKLCFGGKPHAVRPKDPQGAARELGRNELLFVSFCIEMYARRHGMDGGYVLRLFDEKGVCDFLVDCYDPLHSQDREYILDEIELFMKGAANNANA